MATEQDDNGKAPQQPAAEPAAPTGARSRLLGDRAPVEDGGLPWLEPAAEAESGGILSPRVLVGIGVAFVILFAVFIWFFYAHFAGQDQARVADVAPPLIAAPDAPYKERPDDPGGMSIADQDKQVLEGGGDLPGQPLAKLAPPPEQPAPRPQSGGLAAGPAETAEDAGNSVESGDTEDPAKAILEGARQQAAEPAPQPQPQPATAAETAYLIQLGAFSTAEKARAGWEIYTDKYPDQLADLAPDLEPVTVSGRTMVRLRGDGFASRAAAERRCASLKVLGQNCLVVAR
ncbi:MAG: hypothetical protein Tsb0016_04890 [Sphingomonadales bacterium]